MTMMLVARPLPTGAGGWYSDLKGAVKKGKESASNLAETTQNVKQLTRSMDATAQAATATAHDVSSTVKIVGVCAVGALAVVVVAVLRRKA